MSTHSTTTNCCVKFVSLSFICVYSQ